MENKNEPLVSIIMPAYNAEKFIVESIGSVLSQTYKNWELLVINDSSKDNTKNIVENIQKKDSRIKILNQEINKGVVEARNRGIRESRGKYIAFLDSDDVWLAEKLKTQIEYMEINNVYMTFTDYYHMTEEGKEVSTIKCPQKLDYRQALKGNQIGCLTVVINKESIGEFQMPNLRHEDYATWLNILSTGIEAHGINQCLAKYRKVNNSLSSNKLKTIQWTWNIFRKNEKLGIWKSLIYLNYHILRALKKHQI